MPPSDEPKPLSDAIKKTFKKKHGNQPKLPDGLDPVKDIPVHVHAVDPEVAEQVSSPENEKTFHLQATIANTTPGTKTGNGNGLQLKYLAHLPGKELPGKEHVKFGINLKLSWSPDHTGSRPSLNIENGSLRGKLKIGNDDTAQVFRVFYDIDKKVLAAGWDQKWDAEANESEGSSSFNPAPLAQVFDGGANLAFPPTFPFATTGAFFVCDLDRSFLVAQLQTKLGNAFLATGPKHEFGGSSSFSSTQTGSSSKKPTYVSLFGAELKGVEIKTLPLLQKKLSALGLPSIGAKHLGIVAATAAKKEVKFTAPDLSALDNDQFNPPSTAGWKNLKPGKALDFFEKLEVQEGVSLMGELSLGKVSDVFVIPFYRPDEHHHHRKPKALKAPGDGSSSTVDGQASTPITPLIESPDPDADVAAADEKKSSSEESTVHWTPLQSTVAVFDFVRIGTQVQQKDGQPKISILLDVSAKVAGLKAKFYGLGARFKTEGEKSGTGGIVDHFSPVLQGIQIGFNRGGIDVQAGLLRTTEDGTEIYTGDAVLRAEGYGFSGVGSFTTQKNPSLFLFVFLDAPIGTPTIHVEQMAAGFGYNRGAESPHISSLHKYPLIKTMIKGEVDLREYTENFPVKEGNVWLGAGVQFSSWEMINASVIPLLSAGTQSSVNIMGTASIAIPKGSNPPVLIALALEASFSFNTGRLSFGGELLPKTHIVFRDADFKGGFGICTWLPTPLMSSKQKKKVGDYVLTLGGYHPKLTVPSYYPKVPRLGAEITVSDHVSIRGEVYAALTPSAMMFGGTLAAVLQYDAFKAAFQAKLDVLMRWKPLHYDAHLHVNISVQVTVHFFGTHTISAHVGADLHLEGPPIHGTAKIDLSVFSTTVHFGEKPQSSHRLSTWAEFKTSFLQGGDSQSERIQSSGDSLARSPYCDVHLTQGLRQRYPKRQKKPPVPSQNGSPQPRDAAARSNGTPKQKGWIVHPRTLRLEVDTQVPSTTVVLKTKDGSHSVSYEAGQQGWHDEFGVAPTIKQDGTGGIQPGELQPKLTIELHRVSSEGTTDEELFTRFKKNLDGLLKQVPKSMWSGTPTKLSAGSDAHIQDALMGVALGATIDTPSKTNEFAWKHLVEDDKTRTVSSAAAPQHRRTLGDRLTRSSIAKAFQQSGVPKESLLEDLQASGFNVNPNRLSVQHLDDADEQGFLVPPRSMDWT